MGGTTIAYRSAAPLMLRRFAHNAKRRFLANSSPAPGPSLETVAFVQENHCRQIAEIGICSGNTSIELARVLDGRGWLTLFDRKRVVDRVKSRLERAGYLNVTAYGCSDRLLDSYNWPLMKLLEHHKEPVFDYVFIDGAHTWAHDALTFLLVDRLLIPGGYVDFDDYDWTLASSPTVNPAMHAMTSKLYTQEQIETKQVQKVVDLLVRRDSRYREVVKNRIFQKCRNPGVS